MKYNIQSLLGAASIAFSASASAYNFDDQERVLQRTKELKDNSTPFTGDEVNRLKSMIKNGRLKVVPEQKDSLPEAQDEKDGVFTRALKKKGGPPGAPKEVRTRPGGGEKKKGRGRKGGRGKERTMPGPEPEPEPEPKKHHKKAGRNAPPPGEQPHHPKNAGRQKPQDAGRHYNYEDDYWGGYEDE